jgi:2-hydroxy-3-oxopropionate reductase
MSAAPTRVGYIGLGLMGKSIARNILKAGFPVTVFNRSRPAMEELAKEGAALAATPADVARASDVVFTNLPDAPDVEKILFGVDGVVSGFRAGGIFIDNSTIKPTAARDFAARLKTHGIEALDAPVSGGDVGARNGTLTVMVGGDAAALDQIRPVLAAMSKTVTLVGDSGAGQVAKAANQIMVAAQMVAMGELLVFSEKCGVDPEKVVAAIKGGAAQCWTLDVKPPRIFEGNRTPGFKASMQAKDLGIVMDTARSYHVPLPSCAVHTQLFETMLARGEADLDNSAVLNVLEDMSKCTIKPTKAPSA